MTTTFRKSLKRFEIPNQPRFLTFSCHRRLPLLKNDKIKDVMKESFVLSRSRHGFRLLAWVIMPEHVHLILIPRLPDSPVEAITRSLKASMAKHIITQWKTLNASILDRLVTSQGKHRFWQAGGGYDRNIRDEVELFEKIEYVHANPVRRGLVDHPCDWDWSSAKWYAGKRASEVEIDSPW